ncbi:hypothetical protein [Nitrosospira multiformis]|uniref:hypothetical protein n=1 Tax=Nitrosospira multiformis TaxID=1231 RepID=UPI0002F140D6|nr:hypothetical protein [Nitrosospira multiformis]
MIYIHNVCRVCAQANNLLKNRINEIALIRFEEGMESDRWKTLLNLSVSILNAFDRHQQ